MECRIVVGKTSMAFEVPDYLMSAPFPDLLQDAAVRRVARHFTSTYIAEMKRIEEEGK